MSDGIPAFAQQSWRVPLAAGIAAAGSIGAWLLAVEGAELSLGLCALGGCSDPENAAVGNLMMVASLLCLATSVALPVCLAARNDHPVRRALLAPPAVLVVGVVALLLGADGGSGAMQNIAIVALIVTYVSVLTLRPSRRWGAGVFAAVIIAGLLGKSVLAGVLTATIAFVAALAFSPVRRSPGIR